MVSIISLFLWNLLIGPVPSSQPGWLGSLVLEFSISWMDMPEKAKWAPPVPVWNKSFLFPVWICMERLSRLHLPQLLLGTVGPWCLIPHYLVQPFKITSWRVFSICSLEDVHLFSIISAWGSKSAWSLNAAGLQHWSNYNLADVAGLRDQGPMRDAYCLNCWKFIRSGNSPFTTRLSGPKGY